MGARCNLLSVQLVLADGFQWFCLQVLPKADPFTACQNIDCAVTGTASHVAMFMAQSRNHTRPKANTCPNQSHAHSTQSTVSADVAVIPTRQDTSIRKPTSAALR